jgi:imidazolonepropionase-like amidohydrolase
LIAAGLLHSNGVEVKVFILGSRSHAKIFIVVFSKFDGGKRKMILEKLDNKFALIGGTVIDGTGGALKKDAVVVVEDGVIREVCAKGTVTLDSDIQQVDVSGQFIMPGLIDSHVHLLGIRSDFQTDWVTTPKYVEAMRAVAEAQRCVEWGFTTVRDCGSRYSLALKEVINDGMITGPRIISSGLGLCRTGGHGDVSRTLRGKLYELDDELVDKTHPWAQRADGVEEIRKKIRRLISQGVDMIKFWATGGGYGEMDKYEDVHYTIEEMRTICEEAHACNIRVGAHSKNFRAHKMVIEAGVDVIDHFYFCEGEEIDDEIIQKMVEKNIPFIPMLSIYLIPPGEAQVWQVPEIPQNCIRSWRRAYKSGVKLAYGTDAYSNNITPFGEYNIGELKKLVDVLGLTPMEAIVSATKTAAEACGVADKVGTIEKGKLADLLIIDGNPVENIDIMLDKKNILHVIKQGKPIR